MRPSRARLINAARRSMIQRAELRRKLGIAQRELKPAALIGRGKKRVSRAAEDVTDTARKKFRDNRLPIALAAVAGTIWLFREPIGEQAPRIREKLNRMMAAVTGKIRRSDNKPRP